MTYSFLDLVKETLLNANRPLTALEIWNYASELGITQKLNSNGKTPWQTIAARIYMDIIKNPNTDIVQVSKRPAAFFLKSVQKVAEYKPVLETINKTTFSERDIHALLTTFAFSNPHFRCHTKTIFHENSKKNKKGYNKWLHPDIVGIYFPFNAYQANTLKLLETLKENPYKLFSFEMK